MILNSHEINQRMWTWIVVNDLFENWTASTQNNLVSLELSLIITDQGYVRMSLFIVEFFEHQLKMFRECVPSDFVIVCHPFLLSSLIQNSR